ncbi:HNH endonuclease [Streptomyces sp. NBC_01353]|uniref:HNH endonuclease n=1 Tax=Streptomyces sp. NBC_01353 TaxID=2903835 RepID=UPI002E3302F6|nr:HNH endonuclease signature motif containing protein [Streptomyces sp. NBC_01353]
MKGERRRSYEVWEWLLVLEANGGECTYCLKPSQTMDHVIPWARGGLDGLANLVPACDSCNLKKGDKTPPAWWISMQLPWFYEGNRARATPQGDEKTRSLRERYLELHEEALVVLDNLDEVAEEIADPVRKKWFRRAFSQVRCETYFGLWSAPGARERAAICRRSYAAEIAAAREAGWPELKRSKVRFIRRSWE